VDVSVVVNGSPLSRTLGNFVCWNLDASRNRQFFDRNLSQASALGKQLARQARALGEAQEAGYSLLRFGGSGNDYLTYEFNGTTCPPQEATKECLNITWWSNLLDFTEAASARMIFGVSLNTGEDLQADGGSVVPWDPTNARALLSWTVAQGRDHLLEGFELGNEQNNAYTGDEIAAQFKTLYDLTVELWPDASKRPKLYGPDPHSFKQNGPTKSTLDWIAAFMDGMRNRGVPLYAVTHHEYVEVDKTTFLSPQKLDVGEAIAVAVNRTVATNDANVKVIAGEVGPHNGGSPVCDHTSMRWANFGDSLWYADSLGLKARHGYAAHCRQDYIGADYGMLDCSTGEPLPDYWTGLLFARQMGRIVLDTSVTTEDATAVRAYAHCAPGTSPGVAVLLLNLAQEAANVRLRFIGAEAAAGGYNGTRIDYRLAPAGGGILGTGITLNGRNLTLNADGSLPALSGETTTGPTDELQRISVPAESIVIVLFLGVGGAACGPV